MKVVLCYGRGDQAAQTKTRRAHDHKQYLAEILLTRGIWASLELQYQLFYNINDFSLTFFG